MYELCRFGAGFVGLPISKPAKFRGILIKPEKPDEDVFIDDVCRFAGLIPIGETQNTEKFRRMEQCDDIVENLWISPHNKQEVSHAQA